MLKELHKRLLRARRQKAAWERWERKLPHNRVRRHLGELEPMPEPPLDPCFLSRKTLPSGRRIVVLDPAEIERAYRQARYPVLTAEEVQRLPIAEEEVRRRYEDIRRYEKV